MGTVEDYCKYASELGMKALGISNHSTVDDIIDFQKACKKYNLDMIAGIEWYLTPDIKVKEKGEKRDHILTFAKNEIGFQNILRMISIANLEGFFYRPRIDPEILLRHSEGLVFLSGCSSTPLHHGYGRELFENLINKHPGEIYCEIMGHTHKEQYETNQICLDFSEKYNVKLVASNDSHFVRESDAKAHETLLAIGTQKKWSDPNRWRFTGTGFYLRSYREMVQSFVGQGQLDREVFGAALFNTFEVSEKCSGFKWINKKEPSIPKISLIGDEDESVFFERICREAFSKKEFKDDKIYQERFEEELRLIKVKKYENYFLMVWDIVRWCREQNMLTSPGRGSSAGSLIAFLLQITGVDPIKYGLLFARFISESRISDPDIDLDVIHSKRHLVKEYIKKTYGEYNVAGISTFSILRGKGAVRDVCRVFEVPAKDVNSLCSVIETKLDGVEDSDNTIAEALEQFEEGKKFKEKFPEVAKIAISLEGQFRHRGMHAAGIVVSSKDLRNGENCPLVLNKDKEIMVSFDKDAAEYCGVMKLDLLALKSLSVLDHCKKIINENYGIEIDYYKIPLDDEKCYSDISKGFGVGIFQFGSSNMRKFVKQLKIDDFETLYTANALFRPGTLGSGATDSYVRRKNKEEDIPSIHPIIDEITKSTQGIIIFQEQLMWLVHRLAGFTWEETDQVRKIVAKSKGVDALRNYESKFIEGCLSQHTLREEQAIDLWNNLVSFGAYSFNKSHAVVYSLLSYWGLWLRVYYPLEYIVSLLTYGTDNEDMRDEYIEEAFRLKIDVRPPKVGISSATEFKIHDKKIYLPFSSIRGVGDKTAVGFEKLGKKKGFIEGKEPVSKRFLNILEKIGAYEDKALTDEEADEVSQYLGISLVRNKLYKYKKLIKLIDKDLGFSKVKDINLHEPESQDKYYFGLITELNLSVKKGKENKFTAANASFKDETGSCKISFAKEFYDAFPSEIEHCEGEIILLRANTSKRAGSVRVEKAWFQDDLLSAEFGDLGLNILETKRFQNYAVEDCEECDLCKKDMIPRVPKSGRYNIMVVGETGIDIGYDFLRELKKNDIKERDLNFSSFIKCPLKSAKEVARKHVETCSVWLEEEVKEIGPCLILGIGNTAVKFFTEEDTGINNLNGTTVWNEKYGCYVAFCTSPSTLYYGGNNIVQFQDGVKNFCEKAKNMGLGLF
jgi:DNA polymerase-3 subunit alpha